MPDLQILAACFRELAYDISLHAYEDMDHDGITEPMLDEAIGGDRPEVVEDNPTDPRGSSCLILAHVRTEWGEEIPIHVLVGYYRVPPRFPKVITAYLPDSARWDGGYRKRLRL